MTTTKTKASVWNYTVEQLPDADTTVLCGCEDGEVHEGVFDGVSWFFAQQHPYAGVMPMRAPLHGVYAWTDLPNAPPVRHVTLQSQ